MTDDSNRSFLRPFKSTRNSQPSNGVADLPTDLASLREAVEIRELTVGVRTTELDVKDRETELRDHEVDVKIKKLDGGLRTLVVVTGVVGEIVLLTIHPALFILNLPGLVALQWWQEKKQPPDEHGGGP